MGEAKPKVTAIVLGDSTVGKTALINSYISEAPSDQPNTISTIGVEYRKKIITVNNKEYEFLIWDTAGQERFRSLGLQYYRKAQGIALFYDITSTDSFEHLHNWMKSIAENSSSNVPLILIGNKSDKEDERKVPTTKGQNVADEFGAFFFETSAVKHTNAEEAFNKLAELIIYQNKLRCESEQQETESKPIILQSEAKEPKEQSQKNECC